MEILTLTPNQANEIYEYQRPKKILNVFNEKANNIWRKRNQTIRLQKKTPYARNAFLRYLRILNLQFYKPNYYSDIKQNKNFLWSLSGFRKYATDTRYIH